MSQQNYLMVHVDYYVRGCHDSQSILFNCLLEGIMQLSPEITET